MSVTNGSNNVRQTYILNENKHNRNSKWKIHNIISLRKNRGVFCKNQCIFVFHLKIKYIFYYSVQNAHAFFSGKYTF